MILFAGIAASARAADWPPSWLQPTEPFHIVDGIYYVGSAGLGVYLITSPAGHILVDGGLPENAPQVAASIARLGHSLGDVRILLNTHAHFDHSGGLAELKRRSGAVLYAHEGDVSALEGGVYLGSEDVAAWRTTPVVVDRRLADGAVVELGGRTLTLHHTPGHTRGCSSWGLEARDGDTVRQVLIFCSASVAANRLAGPPQYDGIVEDYRATFARARELVVDIPLAPHPEFFGLLEKHAGRGSDPSTNPFVDPTGFCALIDRFEADFERQLAAQTP